MYETFNTPHTDLRTYMYKLYMHKNDTDTYMGVCAYIYTIVSRKPTKPYINTHTNTYMHIFTHTQFVQYNL